MDGMLLCSPLSQGFLSQNAGTAIGSAPVEFSHAPWEHWRFPWKQGELDGLLDWKRELIQVVGGYNMKHLERCIDEVRSSTTKEVIYSYICFQALIVMFIQFWCITALILPRMPRSDGFWVQVVRMHFFKSDSRQMCEGKTYAFNNAGISNKL